MIKPDLIGISSINVPDGDFSSSDRNIKWILVDAEISYAEGDGADIFSLHFATPEAIMEETEETGWYIPRATVIVSQFSNEVIDSVFESILRQCEGKNSVEVLEKLQRYMNWEFEDYQED